MHLSIVILCIFIAFFIEPLSDGSVLLCSAVRSAFRSAFRSQATSRDPTIKGLPRDFQGTYRPNLAREAERGWNMDRSIFGLTHGPRTTNQAWSVQKAHVAGAALSEFVSDTITDAHHDHSQPGEVVPPSTSTAVIITGSIAPFPANVATTQTNPLATGNRLPCATSMAGQLPAEIDTSPSPTGRFHQEAGGNSAFFISPVDVSINVLIQAFWKEGTTKQTFLSFCCRS